jgi:hypothetical protein
MHGETDIKNINFSFSEKTQHSSAEGSALVCGPLLFIHYAVYQMLSVT